MPVEKAGTVQGGALRLSAANGETTQPLPRLATDFVLEIDFQPDDLAGKRAVFALNLRGDEGKGHYRFEIDPDASTYRLSKPSLSTDGVLAEGSLPALMSGGSASLKIFVSGSRLAFVWNDEPLTSVSDNVYRGTLNDIALSVPSGSAAVDIELIKFWDLNPIELEPWVETIAKPLLLSIRDRTPDFEDDFSTANSAWLVNKFYGTTGYGDIQDYVRDGAFRLKPETGQYHHYLQSTSIQARDFILEFDLGIDNKGDDGNFAFEMKNLFSFVIELLPQAMFSPGQRLS